MGQRINMSDKDVLKLNKMYSDTCHNYTDYDLDQVEKWVSVLDWLDNMFNIWLIFHIHWTKYKS